LYVAEKRKNVSKALGKLQGAIMLKDNTVVWVLEYILGGTLVVIPLMGLGFWQISHLDAHIWAVQLFVVCLGVVLISCASSMKQRMVLAKRIDELTKQIANNSAQPQKPAITNNRAD